MQELKITSRFGELVLSDVNTSSIDGDWVPFRLVGFDPNSSPTNQDNINCIDMDGQHNISSRMGAKPIIFTVALSGEYRQGGILIGGGVKQMMRYRRQLITYIPVDELVDLEYNNGISTYYAKARLTEIPAFNPVGSLNSAQFTLIADYPFWFRPITGNVWTAASGSPASVAVNNSGDIASPIIGEITCIKKINDNTQGRYFHLSSTTVAGQGRAWMGFFRNLEAGQKLRFNSGLFNEVWVTLIDIDGTETPANHFVTYQNEYLVLNYPGRTNWMFRISNNATEGELTIQMNYHNLFMGV